VSGRFGTWVGMLDLETDGLIASLGSPISDSQNAARVLIRWHHSPLGYVDLPVEPRATLTQRVRDTALNTFADALDRHVNRDSQSRSSSAVQDWAGQLCCPQRFPEHGELGLSIVVCTRNRPAMLRECLGALVESKYSPLEILIVDNAPSGDDTRNMVEEFAKVDDRVHYACEPAPGLSNARNHALSVAKFDLVAFTDDDVLVDPSWASAVMAGFMADPGVACVTGFVSARSLDSSAERYYDSRYLYQDCLDPRLYDLGPNRGDSPLYPFNAGVFGGGANFAVRREVVTALGQFDSLLGAGGPGLGGEDLDIFARIILSGYRIGYVPSALVWHRHRIDEKELATQVYAYGHGLGAYLSKRLIKHELTLSVLVRGFTSSLTIARRIRRASDSSRLAGRRRLVVKEILGILAGAVCYYRLFRN
jgi:GT2 family glycosyltransferase